MIAMRGVNKWYGTSRCLTDINLTVRTGEKIVLCGPSGSGKSTLIRCINALESYQKGEIVVDGIVACNDRSRPIEAVRREVGMVFQQFNLFPHMTVLENCTLAPMRSRGIPRARPRRPRGGCSTGSNPRIRRTSTRRNCPAVSSSASRSRARSAWSPR